MSSALLVAAVRPAVAQSLWPDSLRGRGEIGIEWVRPTFKSSDDSYSGTRGIWILGGRVQATDRLNLVVAIPRIVATDENGGAMMGNPYAGIEFLKPDHTPEFSIGVRLLMADNTSSPSRSVGFYGDFDRFESTLTKALILTAAGYHEPFHSADGTFARIRFGATFYHPSGYGFTVPNELYFNYGLRIGRDTPNLRASAEVTGRWLLTANGASLAEATVHQAAATVSFFGGQVRPYVGFRMPVDENLEPALEHVLVFGVTTYLD